METLHALTGRHARYLPAWALCFFCVLALSLALIAQHVFGLAPCVLCLYQRIPFAVVAGASLLLILCKQPRLQRALLGLAAFAFAINTGIALYHVGVEQAWWQGTDACAGNSAQALGSIEALRTHLYGAPIARCEDPEFFFLGLSIAAWNVLYCGVLALAAFYATVAYPRIWPPSLSSRNVA